MSNEGTSARRNVDDFFACPVGEELWREYRALHPEVPERPPEGPRPIRMQTMHRRPIGITLISAETAMNRRGMALKTYGQVPVLGRPRDGNLTVRTFAVLMSIAHRLLCTMLSPPQDTPQDLIRRRKGILEPKKANERAVPCDLTGITKAAECPPFLLKVLLLDRIYPHTAPGVPFN